MPQPEQPILKAQAAMKSAGIKAIILEPGPAMLRLTGVRWGRSERTFAVVLAAAGDPAYVVPGFEERRARELIRVGRMVRIWQEDESPFALIAGILKELGVTAGKVGVEDTVRFFVFDGVRQLAPKLDYVSARPVLDGP
ncbi:MAG: aminopeptidase P family N-terminal domain-containing protein [Bryobacteraceae bacterium]